MDEAIRKSLVPGAKVKVTQQIAFRDRARTSTVEGTILDYAQRPTGSWFAHSKGDKLWLDRLRIQRPDGEVVVLNLDEYTRIESAEPTTPTA